MNKNDYPKNWKQIVARVARRSIGVYIIQNKITGKIYVGSSINIGQRFSEHKWKLNSARHANKKLLNAWKKYGAKNFKFLIIKIVSKTNKLAEREQFWINNLKATDRQTGYNLAIRAYSAVTLDRQCKICKRFIKPMRNGRCHSCDMYLRKTGLERPYYENGRKEKALLNLKKQCLRCHREVSIVGYAGKGYCKSCYRYRLYRRENAMATRITRRIEENKLQSYFFQNEES